MTRAAWITVGGLSMVVIGLAVALAISLVGSDDDPQLPGPAGSAAPGTMPSDEFQDCMADHGIEPPEPGTMQRAPEEGLQEALEACGELLPEGDAGGGLRIMPPPSG